MFIRLSVVASYGILIYYYLNYLFIPDIEIGKDYYRCRFNKMIRLKKISKSSVKTIIHSKSRLVFSTTEGVLDYYYKVLSKTNQAILIDFVENTYIDSD